MRFKNTVEIEYETEILVVRYKTLYFFIQNLTKLVFKMLSCITLTV